MKKLLSILLSAAMLITATSSLVFAETSDTVQEATEYTFPSWTLNQAARVQRVYNADRQSWEAKLINGDNTGWAYFLQYNIPQDKLVSGHTYEVKCYLRTESNDARWVALDWGGHTSTTPYVPNCHGGTTVTVTGLGGLYNNPKLAFGFTGAGVNSIAYIDDIVVKDETTGETVDLPNLDFEQTTKPVIEQTGAEYLPGWTVNSTVSRYYNPDRESWEAKVTTDTSSIQWKPLVYYFPKSILTDGHTYTVEAYVRTEGLTKSGQNWLNIEHAGIQKTPDAYDYRNGAISKVTGLAATNFNNHNKISFGFTQAKGTILYVDDVKLIDEQTGEVYKFENTDFEKIQSDYVQTATWKNMSGYAVNSAKVERVYNFGRQSWEAKITNGSNASWSYFLFYYVPRTKLNAEHTYSVTAYLRTESKDNAWVALDWAGYTKNTPYVPNLNNGGDMGTGSLNLYGNNKIAFGFTGAGANSVVYVDDIRVVDETTGEAVELENPGFEKTIEDYSYDVTAVTTPEWVVPENANADIYKYFNIEKDSWGIVMENKGTGGSWSYLNYYIPKSLIIADHTYTIQAYVKTIEYTTASQWIAFSVGGQDATLGVEGQVNGRTASHTGIAGEAMLGENNRVKIGLTASNAATVFVDDLKVIDEVTGEELPLYNGDFEETLEDGITFEGNNGGQAVATVISTEEGYDAYLAWAVYSIDENGTECLEKVNLTPITIEKSDLVQYFTATPEIEAGCVSKAFIWGASSLNSLADAVEFVAVDVAQ